MEQLKQMKDQLTSTVQAQLCGNLHDVDAKELGEAVDMIKDFAEAIYYCTITEAMEKKEHEQPTTQNTYYYTDPGHYRDDREMYDRMYYNAPAYYGDNGANGGMRSYTQPPMYYTQPGEMMNENVTMMHDAREGKSPRTRKSYMEARQTKQDKAYQMKELEKYMQELSQDILEMIQEATPEEKQLLQQKISILATKIK